MTFSNDERFVAPVVGMMMGSREAAVDYMTPLGLHHLMGARPSLWPGPWVAGGPRADWTLGLLPPRRSRTASVSTAAPRGSNAVAQYAPPLARAVRRPASACRKSSCCGSTTCPGTTGCASGRPLWDELVHPLHARRRRSAADAQHLGRPGRLRRCRAPRAGRRLPGDPGAGSAMVARCQHRLLPELLEACRCRRASRRRRIRSSTTRRLSFRMHREMDDEALSHAQAMPPLACTRRWLAGSRSCAIVPACAASAERPTRRCCMRCSRTMRCCSATSRSGSGARRSLGEEVTVALARPARQGARGCDGTLASAVAGVEGRRAVHADRELPAARRRSVGDVLVGDVWLCSGQSNMELQVKRTLNSRAEIADADNDRIRLLKVGQKESVAPRDDFALPVQWQTTNPENVRGFLRGLLLLRPRTAEDHRCADGPGQRLVGRFADRGVDQRRSAAQGRRLRRRARRARAVRDRSAGGDRAAGARSGRSGGAAGPAWPRATSRGARITCRREDVARRAARSWAHGKPGACPHWPTSTACSGIAPRSSSPRSRPRRTRCWRWARSTKST